jgi:hypothetical protein
MSARLNLPSSVDQILVRLRQRVRLRNLLLLGGRGALLGGLAAVVFAVAIMLARPDWVRLGVGLSLLGVPVLAVVGAVVGLLWRVDSLRAARALDRAAASEDRFASALQLVGHRQRARAELVREDALVAVGRTSLKAALPLRPPRTLKWLPLPVLLVVGMIWLAPGPRLAAQESTPPEVSPEEWAALSADFRRQIAELPRPETDEEKEIIEKLEKLAKLLEQQPDQKEALARLAELKADLEKRRQDVGTPDVTMRQAAEALRSCAALSKFGELLRRGEYGKAADELKSLSDKLAQNELNLSALDYESAAGDLERMAQELASHDELNQACKNCANAASSMNRKKLCDSLKRLSECLKKNSCKLKRCDSLCRANRLLDSLKQCLGQCKGCKNGKGGGFVRSGNRKGGLYAGWGTAPDWGGGGLTNQREQRLPDVVEPEERAGLSTVHEATSPDERARSSQDYRERYAELVRKAEADLSLELVPAAYREYLRRYFVAIRPQEKTEERAPE